MRARPAGLLRMPQSNKKRRAWARRFETKPRKRLAERRPAAVEASGRHDRRGPVEAAAIGGRRRPLRGRRGRERVGCWRCRRGRSRGLALGLGGPHRRIGRFRTDRAVRCSRRLAGSRRASARLRQLGLGGVGFAASSLRRPISRAMRSIAPSLFFSAGLVSAALVSVFDANRLPKSSWAWPWSEWRSSPVRQSPSAAVPPRRSDAQPGRRRPRPARLRVPGCAAAARSLEWFRAASRRGTIPMARRRSDCFFTAATNTGCMPPSAPVLTGAAATLRRIRSANWASSRCCFFSHGGGDLCVHLVGRALGLRAERQRPRRSPGDCASNT